MVEQENHIKVKVDRLKSELETLFAFFEQKRDFDKMIYDYWSAKDILGHITFWHESFARNICDLGKNTKPNPLKGKLSEVNKQSVETTRKETIENLIIRLKDAQSTIEEYIYLDRINLIPYKQGSRNYSRAEHLDIVSNHIHKHRKDIYNKYGIA